MAIEQKRIEAAARALMSDWGTIDTPTEREREYAIEKVTFIISAAYPELASDPPTGWVAPWEATDAMRAAVADIEYQEPISHIKSFREVSTIYAAEEWQAARDAHLKEQGHEWPEDR